MKWDWKAVLGIVISALLIWWVLSDVDIGEVWSEVQHARWGYLFAAVAVATSGFLVRAIRWKLLLHPLEPDTSLHNRFAAVNIGFAANNLLPARVGEFARAWSISKLEPVPVTGALGSLVVERFLDAVAVFSLMTFAILHPSFPGAATVGGQPLRLLLLMMVLVLGGILTAMLLLLLFPTFFLRLARLFSQLLPERAGTLLVDGLESFIGGLIALRNPRLLLGAAAWSFGFWAWNAVSFWLAFMAFGIEEGYITALFVQGIIALGVAVPSAPGFFGTFHAAAVIGLAEVYGVGESRTLAFAFGYHLGGFIPVTAMGLWYAGRLGVSMRELGEAEGTVDEEMDREAGSPKKSLPDKPLPEPPGDER